MIFINKNNAKNITHTKGTLPEVIVDRIMIDAIELVTRAQEERIAAARYVTKCHLKKKAFSTETEPGTADWFLVTPHIDFIGCSLFDFIGSGDRSNEVGILLDDGIVD